MYYKYRSLGVNWDNSKCKYSKILLVSHFIMHTAQRKYNVRTNCIIVPPENRKIAFSCPTWKRWFCTEWIAMLIDAVKQFGIKFYLSRDRSWCPFSRTQSQHFEILWRAFFEPIVIGKIVAMPSLHKLSQKYHGKVNPFKNATGRKTNLWENFYHVCA